MGPLITSQRTKERKDWARTRKSYKAFPPTANHFLQLVPNSQKSPAHWELSAQTLEPMGWGGNFPHSNHNNAHGPKLCHLGVECLVPSVPMSGTHVKAIESACVKQWWHCLARCSNFESPTQMFTLHKSLLQSLHGKLKCKFIWFFLLSVWFCTDRVSLYGPGESQTHSNPPASTSQGLSL